MHLQLNSWTNINNDSIIHFITSKPEPLFVKFLNTKDNHHFADYFKEQIIKKIEEYGKDKFFILIGDNASNMQSAFKLVKTKYDHLQLLGCEAHGLNLLGMYWYL